jgi:hypothetical protein
VQREFPHNTDDQVEDYLRRTLAIIDASDVPPDLLPVVFPAIYASVSGKQILIEQASMGSGRVAIPGMH